MISAPAPARTGYPFHFRKTLQLAWPVMLSQLSHILVGLADSLMVGRTGSVALAASSIGIGVCSVILVFALGISYGLTPLLARADGEGNPAEIGLLLKNSFLVNLIVGGIMLALAVPAPYALDYLGQSPEVAGLAKPFIRVFTASLFPLMVFLTFKQFAEGLSSTRPAMIIALAACAVNIGLNYLLIFGNFGFPKMGLQGAAWATFSARCLMAAAMFAYVWYKPAYRMYRFGLNFIGIKWEYCSRILTIGFPVCLQFLFEFGTFAAAAVMAGRFGAGELAAHQIALNLAALTYMAGSGFSAAAAVRVGNYLGRADYRNLALAGKAGFILVGGFMGLCAAAFIGLHNLLPTFYVTDVSVINLAAELLIIAAFFQLSDGIQVVGQGVLRGMGDVRIPTAINLVAFWAFGLPLGYWLGVNLHLRVQGIWYGLLAGLTVAAVLLFFRFLVLTRRARIHIPAFDAAERERQG